MQIVEAVEEHGLGAPAGGRRAQRIERPPRVQLAVDAPELLQPGRIPGVDRGDIPRIPSAPGILVGPGRHRGREPLGRHQRALELSDQLAGGAREPLGARRLAHRPELGPFQRALEHPLALELREPPRAVAGAVGDLERETAERQYRAEDRAALRELARVMVGVGSRRDNENRTAVGRGREPAEHLSRLCGVGWSEYER